MFVKMNKRIQILLIAIFFIFPFNKSTIKNHIIGNINFIIKYPRLTIHQKEQIKLSNYLKWEHIVQLRKINNKVIVIPNNFKKRLFAEYYIYPKVLIKESQLN